MEGLFFGVLSADPAITMVIMAIWQAKCLLNISIIFTKRYVRQASIIVEQKSFQI